MSDTWSNRSHKGARPPGRHLSRADWCDAWAAGQPIGLPVPDVSSVPVYEIFPVHAYVEVGLSDSADTGPFGVGIFAPQANGD